MVVVDVQGHAVGTSEAPPIEIAKMRRKPGPKQEHAAYTIQTSTPQHGTLPVLAEYVQVIAGSPWRPVVSAYAAHS
jgi:hypothetical protein